MFSWLECQILSLATWTLPLHDLGRHVAFIGAALLLCPVQFFATVASISTADFGKTETAKSKEKEVGDDPTTSEEKSSRSPAWILVIKTVVALYPWLAPVTFFWALSVELSKAGALRLSRYLSLTQYGACPDMFKDLSAPELRFVAGKAAGVLALYMITWVALVLPATVVMRRIHASASQLSMFETLRGMPIDERIRNKTNHHDSRFLSLPQAWRNFAWKPYTQLLALYGTAFVISLVAAVSGVQFSCMVFKVLYSFNDDASSSNDYLGWWRSLGLHLKHGFGTLVGSRY